MTGIGKRLCKLEDSFGLGPGIERKLWVANIVGRQLALDNDTCVSDIPEGLNAKETESFLRKNGAEMCGLKR